MESKRVKVLWISCVGEKGGAEVYMLNLLRHLDRSRFQPAVALLRPGPLKDELLAMKVAVHELPAHRMRQLPKVWNAVCQLRELVRREHYALVHSNGFRAHVYGGLAAWRAGVPEVWTVHTVEHPGLSTRAILSIPTAHVVANAPRTADWFVERGLPTSLIWPSIDAEKLLRATGRQALAAKHNLPADARWVTMGARMQRYKGHEFFLRALAALPASHNDVHGVIIGGALFGMEQDYPDALKRLADELGIARRVHFTGFIPDEDVAGLLAASELLVHPALDEDFGLIVAEAQALGKPVLAFAAHGPAAIIVDGETGCLVPVGDQAVLSRQLARILSEPQSLAVMGAAGRARMQRLFDARDAGAQLMRVYGSVMTGR